MGKSQESQENTTGITSKITGIPLESQENTGNTMGITGKSQEYNRNKMGK
jgi:hypothetical protein